ncbi:hypothetical protein CCP4SC76_1380004 [Gammaproteobacteria bacterium]
MKNAQGEYQQVLIEVQKAKFSTDIMRFRRYLDEQYLAGENRPKKAPPILTIYFLGHPLEHTKAPVIRVQRESYDLTTGERLTEREPFIESLPHDSYVVQISHLRRERRTEVEKLLQIFDQKGRVYSDWHLLEIDEEEMLERYQLFLFYLQRAALDPKVMDAMDIEDDVLEELQDLERKVAQAQAEKEQAQAEKERERLEKERLLALLKQAGIEP